MDGKPTNSNFHCLKSGTREKLKKLPSRQPILFEKKDWKYCDYAVSSMKVNEVREPV